MGTEEPHTTLSIMDIKKQALTSASHSDFTLEALRQIAPSAFTEVRDEQGELTHKVDFDVLKELLGDKILDSDEERFGFYWVGKQDAKRAAAEPTRKTLRPVLEDSVDWDNTQNLYIEGDNLEVLKLLQRAYLGKVKMIYIDPPYNTGNDFVYDDDFAMSREDMDDAMGNLDEDGNRLRRNLDSNPRYHSDWCSMIYSRLLVARSLLANDGVIFISIDDNEVHHLRKICDEVFGADSFVSPFIWQLPRGINAGLVARAHEYVFCITKHKEGVKQFNRLSTQEEFSIERCNKKIDARHPETVIEVKAGIRYEGRDQTIEGEIGGTEKITLLDPLVFENGILIKDARLAAGWTMKKMFIDWQNGQTIYDSKGQRIVEFFFKENGRLYSRKLLQSLSIKSVLKGIPDTQIARTQMGKLFGSQDIFSYPKPIELIELLAKLTTEKDSLILDFFSGSATTAHAVMQLNAEDGGKRKYICVQLPEETPEGSEARKAGYSTICEIGKERIRRAGKDILGNLYGKQTEILSCFARSASGEDVDKDPKFWQYIEDEATREQAKQDLEAINERIQNLDTGFRVLRVDTSNMEEVYFEPAALQQDHLFGQVDSVKEDRSDLDLLFGCMVDWGVELSYPLRQEEVAGKHLYIVNEGALVACFEEDIDLEEIREIAKLEPLRVLFRESCFASDAAKLNIYEQFKQLCGWSAEESYRRIHVM